MDTEKTSVLKRKRKVSKKEHDKRLPKRAAPKVSEKKDVRDSIKKIEHNMKATSNVDVPNRHAPITNKRLTMRVGLYNFGKMSDTITRVVSDEAKARAEEDLKKILYLARNNSNRVVAVNEEHASTHSDSSSVAHSSRYAPCSPANKKSKPAKQFDSGDSSYSRFSTPSANVLSSEGERSVGSTKSELPKTPPYPEVAQCLALAFGRKLKSVFVGRNFVQKTRKELDALLKERDGTVRLFKEQAEPEKPCTEVKESDVTNPPARSSYRGENPMDGIAFIRLAEEEALVTHKPPMVPRTDSHQCANITSNYQTVRPPLRPQGVPCEHPPRKPPLPRGRHSLRPVTLASIPEKMHPASGYTNCAAQGHKENTSLSVNEDFATMQSHALHALTQQRRLVFDHGDFYHLQTTSQSSSPSSGRTLMEQSAGDPCCELFRKQRSCSSSQTGKYGIDVEEFPDGDDWDENEPDRRCSPAIKTIGEPVYTHASHQSNSRPSEVSVDLLDYLDTEARGSKKDQRRGTYFTYATPDSDGVPVWKPCSPSELLQCSPTPSPKFYRHKLY